MEFEKIKLVIWDLDNTFWSGTITEGEIQPIGRNKELLLSLTDGGIINSICSKNTYDVVASKLTELGVFDYFVFPSIEWTPKGQRVCEMIKSMSLRPENVLFIDDEITNLEEVKHYSPGIMVSSPHVIPDLIAFARALGKKDALHTRLEQYKLLERKGVEQKKYGSNEDFLFASNVKVEIVEDCLPEAERIHDLIMRSNQLNYTKKRISKQELDKLLADKEFRCGYVSVQDKFGKYGIVGFYALGNRRLEHFLFSCRTIGLGVEQYVYATLNYPELEVSGEVISHVNRSETPAWINHFQMPEPVLAETSGTSGTDISGRSKFLIKSPCDFSKSIAYIKNSDLFDCDFNYVNPRRGNVIEAHNHSVQVVGLKEYSERQKQEILDDCVFFDEDMMKGRIFKEKYDVVFLSTLVESYAGIYREKKSGLLVTFGSYQFPLTSPQYWPGILDGSLFSSNNKFTEEYLRKFASKYEFVGKTTPADYRERIDKVLGYLHKDTRLCLILGVEFPYEANKEEFYKDRHVSHKLLNDEMRKMANENPRILLLDLNEIVKTQADFTDNLNQFTARVYYEISQYMIRIINQSVFAKVENYSTLYVYFDVLLNYTKMFTKRIIPKNNSMYRNLQETYHRLSRKKK
ncbi:MAG TPA: HAD-IIIC family phosphatase [Paludibacter sp.]|nr:HAD-IIIC family phosphatase [Paludibacter sp.]